MLAVALKKFGLYVVGVSVLFGFPLAALFRLTMDSSLYSHIILMPFVVLYLARLKYLELRPAVGSSPRMASGFAVGALVPLLVYGVIRMNGTELRAEDYLFLSILPFVLLLVAGGFLFLGNSCMRALSFPASLLVFLAPMPVMVEAGLEIFFQHTSAEVSHWMLLLTGTPVLRDGLWFKLSTITIQVAQECSGIRSSFVLFITSLIAGHLFLKTTWKKVFLAVFIVPLAIVRNAFRIVTIGLLCVHVGPEMIHHAIHKRGGPVFFALSLIPFFVILLVLRRSDRNHGKE